MVWTKTIEGMTGGVRRYLSVSFPVGWDGKVVWEPCEHWTIPGVDSESSVTEWLGKIEDEIGVGPNLGDRAACPETGTEYEEVLMSRDGHPLFSGRAALYRSAENAWASWAGAFDRYRTGRDGSLYWRVRPEVAEVVDEHNVSQGWRVYARLVIAPPKVEEYKPSASPKYESPARACKSKRYVGVYSCF